MTETNPNAESLPASSSASLEEGKHETKDIIYPQDSEGVSAIDEAKKVLEETKQTLNLITAERKKIEKATAEMLINGKSYAGSPQKVEESAKDYADRVMNNRMPQNDRK